MVDVATDGRADTPNDLDALLDVLLEPPREAKPHRAASGPPLSLSLLEYPALTCRTAEPLLLAHSDLPDVSHVVAALSARACAPGDELRARSEAAEEAGARWQLARFRVECETNEAGDRPGKVVVAAAILQERRPAHADHRDDDDLPCSTSHYIYVPCSYTLLSWLLEREATLLRGRRCCELGAGLGLCSSVLGRLGSAARLVATDGSAAVLPTLRANLEANCGAGGGVEVERLWWGREPEPLAASFDLVLGSDLVMDTRLPDSSSRLRDDHATSARLASLFRTAAALLDPASSGSRVVLAVEPRDRLAAGWLRREMLAAAAAAGLVCVECRERRLDGVARPEWEVDVYVWARCPAGAEVLTAT